MRLFPKGARLAAFAATTLSRVTTWNGLLGERPACSWVSGAVECRRLIARSTPALVCILQGYLQSDYQQPTALGDNQAGQVVAFDRAVFAYASLELTKKLVHSQVIDESD